MKYKESTQYTLVFPIQIIRPFHFFQSENDFVLKYPTLQRHNSTRGRGGNSTTPATPPLLE